MDRLYKLEYLPLARQDMINIIQYISQELCNPLAAEKLANEMTSSAESLTDFPYKGAAYTPIRPLKHEYRKLLVENYVMFYWIDEVMKTVTIARVIYAMRDHDKLL